MNYGHAGRIFVEYCKRIKPSKLREEYEEICKELQKFSSTGKQINNVAVLILADRLASRCLFKKEDALIIEQVALIMKDAKEVSSAYRAQEFILNWIAMNRNHFIDTDDQYPGGQLFGKIEDSYCWVNGKTLKDALTEAGFNFDSVKKEWVRDCFLIKSSDKKYMHNTTIKSVKARYVKLDMDKRDKDGFYQQENLPFCENVGNAWD